MNIRTGQTERGSSPISRRAHWPQFRGRGGSGAAPHGDFPVLALLVLLFCLVSMSATVLVASDGEKRTMRFRLVDDNTGEATTAMICLRNLDDDTVRLPPHGRVAGRVSQTRDFYKGINFDDKNPDWIGPVRKTMGKGNNNDRSYVYELRPSIPYWREPVMFQTRATFKVDLPPGRYRLAVSRGMEYVPAVDEFTVTAGKDQERTVRLKRWVNLAARGWYSGDVHVHHPTLEQAHRDFLLHYAEAEDLHVVNVLEVGHHRGTDFKQGDFGKASRVRRGDYYLVSGQEEPRSNFGHIIGLNMRALARDLPTYDFYDLAFERIHAQEGALVGFAHFSWNGCDLPRGFPWLVTTGELDFIELMQFNALNARDYYDYLNLGFRLTAAAGSDTPWGSTIGEVRTYVYTGDTLDLDTWFENLRRGRTFVSNGPALELTVDGALPGSELRRKAGDVLIVRARAWGHAKVGQPDTLALVGNEGAVREVKRKAGDDGPLEIDVRIPIERSRWLVVSTRCANGAAAHTTPVYVVVDDKPPWCTVNGPRVIRRKLEEIARIEKEFVGRADERSRGIVDRIGKAKRHYEELRGRIVAGKTGSSSRRVVDVESRVEVEIEEEVARCASPGNGAGPLWCYGAPLVVRRGPEVFVSAMETGVDVPPLSNTRPRVFRKMADGPWEVVYRPEAFREREPCPIVGLADGSLLLSVNTSTQPPGNWYGACDPRLLELSPASRYREPKTSKPQWPANATFTDHSYRGAAADRARGEVLLLNIDAKLSHQVWSFRDAAGVWSRPGMIRFPIRACYPQVALRDRRAHVVAIGDIVEPNEKWRRFKSEKTGRKWDYVFRRLFYATCVDVGTRDFAPSLEIDNVDATAGYIRNLDLWLDATGTAHVLYLKQSVQSRAMRDQFFPAAPLRTSLEHVILKDGKVAARKTVVEGGERSSGLSPGNARFHATGERLFVIVHVSGSEGDKRVAENRIIQLLPQRSAPKTIPLDEAFTTFFTACERGGSEASPIVDLFGFTGGGGRLRYARVRID